MRGFFVTGTDTGVGKTEVAACLARYFSEKGLKVEVMKPVATGVKKICHDARVLKAASGSKAPLNRINPISLRSPLAPLMASEIENKDINLDIIWKCFKELSSSGDMIIVEGIGGLMVPIKNGKRRVFYVRDMIAKMKLPVILVARPDLGTINHTLMTVNILKAKGLEISGIIFSHAGRVKKSPAVKTNPSLIKKLSGVKVLGTVYYANDRKKRRIKWSGKKGF
jgi:dethiobiotin synthetase